MKAMRVQTKIATTRSKWKCRRVVFVVTLAAVFIMELSLARVVRYKPMHKFSEEDYVNLNFDRASFDELICVTQRKLYSHALTIQTASLTD